MSFCIQIFILQKVESQRLEIVTVGLHYYAGIVENAEDLIERHKVATQCSFVGLPM